MARLGIGIAIGGLLAVGGLAAGGTASGESVVPAESTTVTTAPPVRSREPAWIEEGGARYDSTVVVVDGVAADDGAIVLDYRLVSLGESGDVLGGGTQLPGVLPETWKLVSTTGNVVAATSDPPARNGLGVDSESAAAGVADSIRFEGDQALAREDVATISVTSWRVALPLDFVVSMAGQKGASARLHDGTTITLDTILEQRTGAILAFSVERPSGQWRTTADQGFGLSTQYVGAGPGWLRAASTIGGIGLSGGATGFQLVWHEPTPPATVGIQIHTVEWLPRQDDLLVWPAS